jgi:hypothetical protein
MSFYFPFLIAPIGFSNVYLEFLGHVIINKNKVRLPQACAT